MRDPSIATDAALHEVFGLFAGLADREHREEAAAELARYLGGDELVLFSPDPELGVLLPAPGLPQTLRGAAAWKSFLAECVRDGDVSGTLPRRDGHDAPAVGCAAGDGSCAVLLGDEVSAECLGPLRPLLPLLGTLFSSERRVEAGEVRARSASRAAERARVLTRALQQARGKLETALAEAETARTDARERAEQAEALASELQAQAAQLQEQALELEVLNDELAVRTGEAESARDAADAANRAKSDFLANMSHELRTPINAVIGYAELLALGITGPVTREQKLQLERIRVSSAHLLTLVNEVLDLAKVEAGRMSVEHQREEVAATVAEALALIEIQAADRGLELENACDDPDATYVGDRDRARQILANLLSNAVKFTSPGGSVRVRCRRPRQPDAGAQVTGTGPWVGIMVEDTGIGISAEELPRVFQPFVQADSGRTRSHGGTGLGLTISRQLARLMGGDLTVESEPGKGSRFTLWLPASTPAAGPLDATIRVGAPREGACPAGLFDAGEVLRAQLPSIVGEFARRLREDRSLPFVSGMDDGEILDHAPVFIADLAGILMKMGRTGSDPAASGEDSDVQRLIAERHGADRALRGWTTSSLRHEFRILREQLATAVERAAEEKPGIDVPGVLRVLDQLLEAARLRSLASLQAAAVGDPTSSQR